jgi:hypothetical protein
MDIVKRFNEIFSNRKLFTKIVLIISILFITLLLLLKGFSPWIGILIFLWITFTVVNFTKLYTILSSFIWLILFSILLILSISFFFVNTNSKNSTNNVPKLTPEECKPYAEQYDGKVLNISGENLIGSIGISIDPEECRLIGRYIITFTADLPENPEERIAGGYPYNYIVLLRGSSNAERKYSGGGVLSVVRRNGMSLPDAFSDSISISDYYMESGTYYDGGSSNFYWTYLIDTDFSKDRYEKIFKEVYFDIVDGLPFIEVTDEGDGFTSSSINHERAEIDGDIVKSFKLTISE